MAELAGTTLKTVRHYHDVGLLEEPERLPNGYKRYKINHLVRLLWIRWLVGLGMPLSRIAAMDESDEGVGKLFRTIDDELAACIERQRNVRTELAGILRHHALIDLPSGFGEVTTDLSEPGRTFLLICSRVLEPAVLESLLEVHKFPRSQVRREFDELTDKADDRYRQSLAERFVAEVVQEQQDYPLLRDLGERAASGEDPHLTEVLRRGAIELHNAAQLDVLTRMNAIVYPKGQVAMSSPGG
ncbi:MerR family transcriptional regulator [Streptomyces sp. FR-108]|uniref:MerR family transcriptional regulator n=1 Tax=Streptomyces sp. FR-108 TaxID=3416665 RepID=UPI003CF59205